MGWGGGGAALGNGSKDSGRAEEQRSRPRGASILPEAGAMGAPPVVVPPPEERAKSGLGRQHCTSHAGARGGAHGRQACQGTPHIPSRGGSRAGAPQSGLGGGKGLPSRSLGSGCRSFPAPQAARHHRVHHWGGHLRRGPGRVPPQPHHPRRPDCAGRDRHPQHQEVGRGRGPGPSPRRFSEECSVSRAPLLAWGSLAVGSCPSPEPLGGGVGWGGVGGVCLLWPSEELAGCVAGRTGGGGVWLRGEGEGGVSWPGNAKQDPGACRLEGAPEKWVREASLY